MKAEINITLDDDGIHLQVAGGSVTDVMGMLEVAKFQMFTDNIEHFNNKFQVRPLIEEKQDD